MARNLSPLAALSAAGFGQRGSQYSFRFSEKGGKQRAIPVRHDLQVMLSEYLDLLGGGESKDYPLFRSMSRKGTYSELGLSGVDICRLVKRRLRLAEPPGSLSNFAAQPFEINPGFIRYVFSKEGWRIGITTVFGITDEAFDATIRGERAMYSYSDHEMVSKSNNLVLFAMCEIHGLDSLTAGKIKPFLKRKYMMGSMLAHVSRLLDADGLAKHRSICNCSSSILKY